MGWILKPIWFNHLIHKIWEVWTSIISWFVCSTSFFLKSSLDSEIIAYHSVYPPNSKCINVNCMNALEGLLHRKDGARKIMVYGINGAYVGFSVHLLCHCKWRVWDPFHSMLIAEATSWCCHVGCSTNYHHNFSINAEFHTYYGGVPNLIQVGEHQFIEKRVFNLFIGMMLVAWYVYLNVWILLYWHLHQDIHNKCCMYIQQLYLEVWYLHPCC